MAKITDIFESGYYDGNDGASKLPIEGLSIVSGKGNFFVDSVSNDDFWPDDSIIKIELEKHDILDETSLDEMVVIQWITDSDLDVSDNILGGSNVLTVADWLEKASWDSVRRYRSASGITGEVVSKVLQIGRSLGFDECGHVDWRGTFQIHIKTSCGGLHRKNTGKELDDTVIHEARHLWQHIQLYRTGLGATGTEPKNDSDEDGCPEIVEVHSEAGIGDNSPIQDGAGASGGDDEKNEEECRNLNQTDASDFAKDHK